MGPAKNAELFLDDARILPISVNYGRSALLLDRIIAAKELEETLDDSGSIVIDPVGTVIANVRAFTSGWRDLSLHNSRDLMAVRSA